MTSVIKGHCCKTQEDLQTWHFHRLKLSASWWARVAKSRAMSRSNSVLRNISASTKPGMTRANLDCKVTWSGHVCHRAVGTGFRDPASWSIPLITTALLALQHTSSLLIHPHQQILLIFSLLLPAIPSGGPFSSTLQEDVTEVTRSKSNHLPKPQEHQGT